MMMMILAYKVLFNKITNTTPKTDKRQKKTFLFIPKYFSHFWQ
jgi:hypothetical protein